MQAAQRFAALINSSDIISGMRFDYLQRFTRRGKNEREREREREGEVVVRIELS